MRGLIAALSLVLFSSIAFADTGSRVPGETWMTYVDAREAGFDPEKLKAAHEVWEELPSSAFMVIAGGAVVAAWGDTDRRFMCHSVRKSFLSALYGIYWDRQEIDLNKTLFDLGIDDTPDPLLDSERQARILDLLKARSGIFHSAAYAGRTDSAARGSQGAGRYFAYNNWDFNTLATILIEETGDDIFESFDEHFAEPLGMEDWRVSDGYYHLERDKSRYPAYPFRMSARDAARFGLLFAREGQWGEERVLSKHWVRRSSALYSIDDEVRGYGFMWWVYRQPRFERHGMYAALGVGNQMIAVLPELDMVIVNRADTYEGQFTPGDALNDLIARVIEARTGKPVDQPELRPLAPSPDPKATAVAAARSAEMQGRWDFPPKDLGLPARTWVELEVGEGYLTSYSPVSGTFKLYLQADGTLHEEDSHDTYHPVHDGDGKFVGLADSASLATGALVAMARGDRARGSELLSRLEGDSSPPVQLAWAIADLFRGEERQAEKALEELVDEAGARSVERMMNVAGYQLLGADTAEPARDVFAMATRLFPESSNVWDSLGEAHMTLGEHEQAKRFYGKSLELDPGNQNAVEMIERMEKSQ